MARSRTGWILITVLLLLGTGGCTRFQGLKPLEPAVGRPAYYRPVTSLQPVLAWEASPEPGVRYDLIICTTEDAGFLVGQTGHPGDAVYYREGLQQPMHKVETPLEPRTKYLWSVRVRRGDDVSAWSSYEYMYGGRIGQPYLESGLPYRFSTPDR